MVPKVFISYSRRDFPFVRDLVRSLRAVGIEVWLDITSLSGADRWNDRIAAALKECTHCLVIVSPYSMKSAQVAREIEVAIQNQKEIVPLLLQTTILSERLQAIQWIDFRVSYERAIHFLVAHLRAEPRTAADESLEIPRRPARFLGIVALITIVCPRPVKVISVLVYLSGSFKVFVGLACTIVGDQERIFIGWVTIAFVGFLMWWDYRTINRRVPFWEAVFMQSAMLLSPLFGLVTDQPILYFFITVPLDLALLVAILVSKTFRRWMPAYPSWSK